MKFNSVRFTNGLLLILIILLTLSGIYSLFRTYSAWLFSVHRAASWGLLALLPWKVSIIYRSLRRKAGGQHFHQSRLAVTGDIRQPLQLDYDSLSRLPVTELDATIDCTLGWSARQTWRGVRLADVLEQAGFDLEPAQISLKSVTGYEYALPWREVQGVVLATHVGGETLSAAHGYPLRAVVSSRRGWFWIKWLAEVKAN